VATCGAVVVQGVRYTLKWWRGRSDHDQVAGLPSPSQTDESTEMHRTRARVRFIEWNTRD
jgi:hypothetical protein